MRVSSAVAASSRLARPKSVTCGWPSRVEQDVGRLQVAVEDARAGGRGGRPGRRVATSRAAARGSCRGRAARRGEAAAVDQLHAEVVAGRRARRPRRSARCSGGRGRPTASASLRNRSISAGSRARPDRIIFKATSRSRLDLPGPVDDPHAPPADLPEQFVAPQAAWASTAPGPSRRPGRWPDFGGVQVAPCDVRIRRRVGPEGGGCTRRAGGPTGIGWPRGGLR